MILVGNFVRNKIDVLKFFRNLSSFRNIMQKPIFGAILGPPPPPQIGKLISKSWGLFCGTSESLTEPKEAKFGQLTIFSLPGPIPRYGAQTIFFFLLLCCERILILSKFKAAHQSYSCSQLLYRSVQCVNLSHDACHAQMDVKLRSLICIGLNEQVLHLWFEILCSSMDMVEKW